MTIRSFLLSWLLATCVFADNTLMAASPPTAEGIEFFEKRIRPVLVDNCYECHSAGKKTKGGLALDTRAAVLRGGDSGAVVVPGDPEKSTLIEAVRYKNRDLQMPPKGALSDEQVRNLETWIKMGVPDPREVEPVAADGKRAINIEEERKFWSFAPLSIPALPMVQNRDWVKSPVDAFILAELEKTGLNPAPPADKRTLIRRATFDLIGLPPTPEEVHAFVADEDADALGRVIERLLSSPSYGERWGRHWLDVARYADSNGLDENVAHGNAWRYRDYVVAAFNRDKPFDRFLIEQLTGDLLEAADEAQRHEHLIATGFLGIGPKVLAETDEAKMRMDIVDEQIDTVGRVFLGLTLGCARCHDHKFDPIETADYYGLAGIFKSTRTMDQYTKVAKWHENLLPSAAATAMQAEYNERLAAKKQAIEMFVANADKQAREKLAADATEKPPEKLETLYPEATKSELKKLRDELALFEKTPPELPSAIGVTEDKVVDVAIHMRGNPLKLGDVVPRHAPPVMHGPRVPQFTDQESGRRQLTEWLIDPQHPLTARVFVNRVWRWHFGKGLVRTTDNFGRLGEVPSHPELLDWLARRFIADGWSIKSLHRMILNSSMYQQSSTPSAETVAGDPENRLLSRADVRRLEAEAVRDSLLAVSGRLDQSLGGSVLTVKNRDYLFDHTSKDLTTYTSRRRSLYLPVIRNNVYDLFQLLDFPDPAVSSGNRTATTVAPQALLMLNSDIVMQSASDFAERLLTDSGDDNQRLSRLYAIAYGREASDAERNADRAFLAKVDQSLTEQDASQRRLQAWSTLCQVVLAANEFIYVK